MSRAPLVDLVRRALRLSRGAASAGVPVREWGEAIAEREQRLLARRRFLQMSAVGAGTLGVLGSRALTACTTASSSPPRSGAADVVIVGGGLAGCHCAYRLRQHGVRADVYEASSRLGGRTFTARTRQDGSPLPDGMHAELGGELIDSDHLTMQTLAGELGIPLLDYAAPNVNDGGPAMIDMLSPTGWIMGKKLTVMDLAAAFAPLVPAIDAALATLTDPTAIPSHDDPNGAAALDAMSIAQWMDSAGFSGPIRKVLEVAYLCEYGLELDVSNALNFLVEVGTDPNAFSIFGASDERYTCATGNQSLVDAMAKIFPDAIHLDSQLVALKRSTDGARYVATFTNQSGTSVDVTATHVVLALPFSVLREVKLDDGLNLPPVKTTAIRQLAYGTNAKLVVGFGSRPWQAQGLGGGEIFTDAEWQDAWEASRQQAGSSGLITNFRGGNQGIALGQGTETDQASAFLGEFDQLVNGAKQAANGVALRMHWPSHPYTKGSYAAYAVGQYTLFAGAEGERVENLHFCGEHTSRDFQGFMEGAAETGLRAAMEILVDLKLAPAPPIDMGDAAAMDATSE